MPQKQFSKIYEVLSDSNYQTLEEVSDALRIRNIHLSPKQIYDSIYRNRMKDYLIDINTNEKPYKYKKLV